MTIDQRKKKIEELTTQIKGMVIKVTTDPIQKMFLKHALRARWKHMKIIEKENSNGTTV